MWIIKIVTEFILKDFIRIYDNNFRILLNILHFADFPCTDYKVSLASK